MLERPKDVKILASTTWPCLARRMIPTLAGGLPPVSTCLYSQDGSAESDMSDMCDMSDM